MSAAKAISQTRRRKRFMSAAAIVQHFEKFVDLGLSLAVVAGMERVCNAMLQMIRESLLLDAVERRAHGPDLGQHVDAITIFFDHAGNATHLALDATESGELGFLQLFVHALNYTRVGYTSQA